MNYLDFAGTVLSLIGTYFFVKADLRMWPTYILAILINTTLYFNYSMYASVFREVIYLFMSVYGWIFWKTNTRSNNNKIYTLTVNNFLLISLIYAILFFIIFSSSTYYTDSKIPYLESIAVTTCFVAQILSSRKFIECWFAWLVADSLYVLIMLSQNLYFHSILYGCYLFMALMGIYNWNKIKNTQKISAV